MVENIAILLHHFSSLFKNFFSAAHWCSVNHFIWCKTYLPAPNNSASWFCVSYDQPGRASYQWHKNFSERLTHHIWVCPKIVKLSFSFEPENRKQYHEPALGKIFFDLLSQGFGKLTHLKMFVLNESFCYLKCWFAILEMLKYVFSFIIYPLIPD